MTVDNQHISGRKFLKPCACGGKPWFNLGAVKCIKCPNETPRLSNWEEAAEEWNGSQCKVKVKK